jgi:hypothetical protein
MSGFTPKPRLWAGERPVLLFAISVVFGALVVLFAFWIDNTRTATTQAVHLKKMLAR